jgi:leader peptidase (prepilin peptidase)/N-methyltransferase
VPDWLWLVVVAALGLLAAFWLRGRRYRQDDDEVQRTVGAWWVPVLAVPAAAVGGTPLAGLPTVVLLTYALALVWALVLAVIDLEVLRLPDRLVLPAYPVVVLLLALAAVLTGDAGALLRALACAGLAVACFLLAALLSPGSGGLGLGDVKLAGVLGALLGWLGWREAAFGLLGGFVVGAAVSLLLLALRRVDRQGSLPFGPSMLAGAYLCCLLSPLI